MRRLSVVFMALGSLLVAADFALRAVGLSPSYNFGDPANFEFYLVGLWHVGLSVLIVSAILYSITLRSS